ncbi:hypothetical protein Dda_2065 [Drechslerella dactyloides]|uniref:N-acetyltransferase domain-containing protein n=1 Tax=Drechslerella dactyloides TaxID=74499 RepID=A0AAD6NL55_DREDA|nr:hypothetical protein Dda_2065 [Drechslerella dactyloides]
MNHSPTASLPSATPSSSLADCGAASMIDDELFAAIYPRRHADPARFRACFKRRTRDCLTDHTFVPLVAEMDVSNGNADGGHAKQIVGLAMWQQVGRVTDETRGNLLRARDRASGDIYDIITAIERSPDSLQHLAVIYTPVDLRPYAGDYLVASTGPEFPLFFLLPVLLPTKYSNSTILSLSHFPAMQSMALTFHPKSLSKMNLYVRTLTINDLDKVIEMENACFPEGERGTPEKPHPDTPKGVSDFKPKEILVAMIIGSKTDAATVTDASMRVPSNTITLTTDSALDPSNTKEEDDSQNKPPTTTTGSAQADASESTLQPLKVSKPVPDREGHVEAGDTICIHSMCVAPSYRSMGHSQILLKDYISRMRDAGVSKRIALICHREITGVYTKAGFRYRGTSKVTHGGGDWRSRYKLRVTYVATPNYKFPNKASASGANDGKGQEQNKKKEEKKLTEEEKEKMKREEKQRKEEEDYIANLFRLKPKFDVEMTPDGHINIPDLK